MFTQAELKRARSLRDKKGRGTHGRFLVQGLKQVIELIASERPYDVIYATDTAALQLPMAQVTVVPHHDMDRLGTLESGNEVVAVVPFLPQADMEPAGAGELILALDGVSDPGNVGTILRVADHFGVRRVLLSAHCADEYNPKCVQASMGALLRVRTRSVDLPQALSALAASGAAIYRAEVNGGIVFHEQLRRPAVLILGSESHGITSEVQGVGGTPISIPNLGGAESLNVGMAASALCMEFARQAEVR